MADKLEATFGPYPVEDDPLPTLDDLLDSLTDAAGLLDATAQHLSVHRREGRSVPAHMVRGVEDQTQVAWATVKTAQSVLRDLIALQVPRA